jgi:hypothetical protein
MGFWKRYNCQVMEVDDEDPQNSFGCSLRQRSLDMLRSGARFRAKVPDLR